MSFPKLIKHTLKKRYYLNFTFLFFCLSFSINSFAQWTPQNADTNIDIYRSGNVGIGLINLPDARLHIRQAYQNGVSGQEVGIVPTLRLQRDFATNFSNETFVWDLFSNEALEFRYGDGNSSALGMRIRPTALELGGNQLILGYGGTSNVDNMILGYSSTLNGHFITFNGTYGEGIWQGPNGKAVILSEQDGSLYFLTQPQGGYISPTQNRRLSILPEGTAVIGDTEKSQLLTISSTGSSTLRLQKKGGGIDYELARNNAGDFEIRGGVDGSTDNLPNRMTLKSTGELLVGTQDAPDQLGDADISAYRLYVEGGVLSKEMRVRTNWADYVFDKDYQLLSLEQVKAHIETEGHLHNTPSAEVIQQNGLALGEMTTNQQEKIEEIYLHLIQMNEKLSNLEAENVDLKAQLQELKNKH